MTAVFSTFSCCCVTCDALLPESFFYVTSIFSPKLCNNPVALRGQFFSSAASTFKFFLWSDYNFRSRTLNYSPGGVFLCRAHSWSILLQKWLLILLKSTLSFISLPTSQLELLLRSFDVIFRKSQQSEIGPLIETAVERTLKWTWKKTKWQVFINCKEFARSTEIHLHNDPFSPNSKNPLNFKMNLYH